MWFSEISQIRFDTQIYYFFLDSLFYLPPFWHGINPPYNLKITSNYGISWNNLMNFMLSCLRLLYWKATVYFN